jgi:hypothetical protein
MNFKSNAAYKKWLAYGHASGEFAKTPGNQPVSIKGQSHKVKHGMGGNMYADGGSFNNSGFKALPVEIQNKIKKNSMAMGGMMSTQMPMQNPYNPNFLNSGVTQNFAFGGMVNSYAGGGMLDNQLTEFNNGGRHEENPIGGIPQGFAPDGRVNLVEQGETKLNSANYIFSDTLKVTKDIALDYDLPKDSIGKTFADASKKMNRPNSRRENDTIEEVAKQRDLDNLMQAQEDFKQRDLQKDIDMMAEKHPEFMSQMMGQGQQGMPEEMLAQGVPPDQMMEAEQMMQGQIPQSIEPMGMSPGMPVDPNQIPPEMLAQMAGAQQGMPIMRMGGNMYMCGGKMYDFGGKLKNKNSNAIQDGGGDTTPVVNSGATGSSDEFCLPNGICYKLSRELSTPYGFDARGFNAIEDSLIKSLGSNIDFNKLTKEDALNAILKDKNFFDLGNKSKPTRNGQELSYDEYYTNLGDFAQDYINYQKDRQNAFGNSYRWTQPNVPFEEAYSDYLLVTGKPGAGGEGIDPNSPDNYYGTLKPSPELIKSYENFYGTTYDYKKGGYMYGDGGFARTMGNLLQTAAPIAGQAFNAVIPGSSVVVSGALSGLGAGLENVGTGADFKEVMKDVGLGAASGAIGGIIPGENMSEFGKFAIQKAAPQAMNAVSNLINDNTDDASEMQAFREQEMATVPQSYSGYNLPSTRMKYGGYKAQAPWHNFPQYTPNYPGNAGPMYMGLGTNLFAYGGPTDPPGPGEPSKNNATTLGEVVITANPQGPVMLDNPLYDKLMEQHYASLPSGGKYKNQSYYGTSTRDADLTRKLTAEELANWTTYHQNKVRQEINSLKAQGQDYSEKLAEYSSIPKSIYVPTVPEGMGADYYSKPENWYYNTKYLGENYPKPSKQIEDIFATTNTTPQVVQEQAPVLPTITMAEAEAMKNKAMQEFGSGILKGKNWNYNEQPKNYAGTQAGGGMFNYWDANDPTQAANQKEYEQFIQDQLAANPDKTLYSNLSGVDIYSNPNYETELAKNINEGSKGNLYDQFIAKKYNEYISNPEWVNSLSEEDKAKYLFDKSKYNVQMNVPEVMGFANGGYINRNNTMYSPDLTYSAKMGGRMYNYGGGLKNPLMSLPQDNFIRYEEGGRVVQGGGTDPYQYKYENGEYYTAKKGTSSWTKIDPTNRTAYSAVKNIIDTSEGVSGGGQYDLMMANIAGEESGDLVPPTMAEVEANRAIALAEEKMQNAETSEEYQQAVKEYEYGVRTADEALKDKNLNLSMKQSALSGIAMAAPAAYNLTTGIFGKPEQLDYRDYEIAADITPYEYNINPQLAAANQTYAQAQEAARNAANAGAYLANMQQLGNMRNQTIGELYTNKQNLDAQQAQAAKTANKQIQTDNLLRKLEIEDFNRLSKAQKTEALKAGLVQTADIGKNMEDKKLQLALIKSMAPDFANTLSYNVLGEQFLEFLKNQKAGEGTSTTPSTSNTSTTPTK